MKIPAILLGYWNYDHILKCIESFNTSALIDVYYVDAPSKHRNDEVLARIKNLVRETVLLDRNMGGSSFNAITQIYADMICTTEYVIISDGDIEIHPGSIEEQVDIIESSPDIVCCSQRLSEKYLPLETFPNAHTWLPQQTVYENYCKPQGGIHSCLFRSEHLLNIAAHFNQLKRPMLDSYMSREIEAMGKHWVTTKHHKADHLTWLEYQNPDSEYTQMKLNYHWDCFSLEYGYAKV